MEDVPIDEVLRGGLRRESLLSLNALVEAMADSSGRRHSGKFPSYVMASPAQVRRWADDIHLTSRVLEGRREEMVALFGAKVIEVAGPVRLIWSEEVGS